MAPLVFLVFARWLCAHPLWWLIRVPAASGRQRVSSSSLFSFCHRNTSKMTKAAYELVIGLNKGHKVVKHERKERPAHKKNKITKVSSRFIISSLFIPFYSLFPFILFPQSYLPWFLLINFSFLSNYSITDLSVIWSEKSPVLLPTKSEPWSCFVFRKTKGLSNSVRSVLVPTSEPRGSETKCPASLLRKERHTNRGPLLLAMCLN